MLPGDLGKLYVRHTQGEMVPFSSFATGRWTSGPPQLSRFNGFPSINIWGEPKQGISSGEAMQAMEEAVAKLPKGIGYDWTGLSYKGGCQSPGTHALRLLVLSDLLCLAALYEAGPSISIMLVLPLGVIGGVIASSMRGMTNESISNRLLTTMGLTTKNAILIVQFAKGGSGKGNGLIEAIDGGGEACVSGPSS
jgi:HAE1 family hydrophobic/amphiphilic exporter-1